MAQNLPLSNISIVVTRPSRQSDSFCQKLHQLGASPIAFPCIDIIPIENQTQIDTSDLDFVIFVSPNAVVHGLNLIPDPGELSTYCKFAAVGPSTAESLINRGVDHVLCSTSTTDSEGLLDLPEFQSLEGKSVLIIKGSGGRTLLKNTLIKRGAKMLTVDTYERALPKVVDTDNLRTKIDLILFTSSEIAENFLAITPKDLQKSLLNCQVIAGHQRIAEKVSTLGFEKLPIIAASPADREMLATIKLWAQKNGEK